MIHINDLQIEQSENTAISIGNFDGMHTGHINLIKELRDRATKENLKSVIFSFYPHPKFIVTGKDIDLILTREEKISVIENMGIDLYVEYPFDKDFAETTPKYFIEEILAKKMKCKVLIIGEGYRFGKGQQGDINFIKEISKRLDIKVVVVPHEIYKSEKLSSTNIRNLILKGDMQEVAKILHTPYFIKSSVIEGNKLGRTIGFPTANISIDSIKILPPNGVYITKTKICKTKKEYKSITNIGFKPTVQGNEKTVETFLLNFENDIYSDDIIVYFYERIRDEKKFNSLDELKEQIAKDVVQAKKIIYKT